MSLKSYTTPVASLLSFETIGSHEPKDWPNYVEILGFTQADVPELIRLATDPQLIEATYDDDEMDEEVGEGVSGKAIWAPLHAMRALGQLRAEEAIAPLVKLLQEDDDYFRENLPGVFGLIGPAAIAPLASLMDDDTQDLWARVAASDGLEVIAINFPDARPVCITVLMDQLAKYSERQDEILDSSLVDTLAVLQAQEAAPLIEEVFAQKGVDEFVTYSRQQSKLMLLASPTGSVLPLATGFELFIVRKTSSPTVEFCSPQRRLAFLKMLSIATLETGDLRLEPTGRSTPVVGRKHTVSGENQPCSLPSLPDWRLLVSPLRRHADAQHTFEGDSQPPRFHPDTRLRQSAGLSRYS